MVGFAGRPKTSDHNNIVTVLPRWPKAGFHCTLPKFIVGDGCLYINGYFEKCYRVSLAPFLPCSQEFHLKLLVCYFGRSE